MAMFRRVPKDIVLDRGWAEPGDTWANCTESGVCGRMSRGRAATEGGVEPWGGEARHRAMFVSLISNGVKISQSIQKEEKINK